MKTPVPKKPKFAMKQKLAMKKPVSMKNKPAMKESDEGDPDGESLWQSEVQLAKPFNVHHRQKPAG